MLRYALHLDKLLREELEIKLNCQELTDCHEAMNGKRNRGIINNIAEGTMPSRVFVDKKIFYIQ